MVVFGSGFGSEAFVILGIGSGETGGGAGVWQETKIKAEKLLIRIIFMTCEV